MGITVLHCAVCSTKQFLRKVYQNDLALITIHYFNTINGKQIFTFCDIEEIKCVPHAPLSHPFVERLIGTIWREHLDQTLFWNTGDLEK